MLAGSVHRTPQRKAYNTLGLVIPVLTEYEMLLCTQVVLGHDENALSSILDCNKVKLRHSIHCEPESSAFGQPTLSMSPVEVFDEG